MMGDFKRDVLPADKGAASYVVSYAVGILCPRPKSDSQLANEVLEQGIKNATARFGAESTRTTDLPTSPCPMGESNDVPLVTFAK